MTRASDEFSLALEFDWRVAAAGATRTFEIAEGLVVLNDDLPNVHSLNLVIVGRPLPMPLDARALVALADRRLGHLSHRFVRIGDPKTARRVAADLERAGWERDDTVFMVMREDPRDAIADPRAREISDDELDAVTRANFEHYDYGPGATPGIVGQLVAGQRAMRAATAARAFGAGEDGGLQAMCTLYLDPDVSGVRIAMVEQVGTLPEHRERGLAKAVVSAAVAAAGEWGAELITVPADANDWPQLLYARLGFAPAGVETTFTLRNAAAQRAT